MSEVKEAVIKIMALNEVAILALEKINETDSQNVVEVLRETRKYTSKLYEELGVDK